MRARIFLAAGLFAWAFHSSQALVIFGGTGTQQLTPPASDPGWANVGSRGVYLGNYGGEYWVATATHVGAGAITFGSTSYSAVPGSAVSILNPNSTPTDLTLFRITSDPGLATLALATTAPASNAVVRLVGNGGIENVYTKYDVTETTWTVSTSDPFDAQGYTVTSSAGKRWGDSTVGGTADYSLGAVTSNGVYTVFSAINGSSQGAGGDSGGAMFSYNGSSWELAGILSAISTYDGQPGGTAIVGNLTWGLNIAYYRPAILAAIPEPADVALWVAVIAAGVGIWRRRRQR